LDQESGAGRAAGSAGADGGRAAGPTAGAKAKGPLKPAYLILGDDGPKVEAALRRLRLRIMTESGTELNIDEFQAAQHDAHTVLTAANTLAFLGGVRLVLVHGIEAWRKADKDQLVAYLRSPAPDACLALVGAKLPASDALRKAVASVGDVLEYQAPKAWQLPEWAAKEAGRVGLQLGPPEARLLVQRVGEHQQIILRELEKLLAYRGKGKVTAEEIERLTPRSLEASIFDLVDAVALREPGIAFAAIEDLYAAGEKANGLFARLLRHFQQLARVVALREQGWTAEQIQQELKLKPFPAKKLWQQSGRYTAESATRALAVFADTDARLKGMGDLSPELELELCLGRLLAPD